MENHADLPKRPYAPDPSTLPAGADRILAHFHARRTISRDINELFTSDSSFGQRLADKVASFGGSWTFIMLFGAVLLSWVALNSLILARREAAFDPYPYILLNLFLSMLASIQAPLILMSQNRQAAKDRLDATHDYEVNLKAELEILALHDKLDALREGKWKDLIRMQQEQIALLTAMVDKLAENQAKAT